MAVHFIDTSVLCNLIPVPGRDNDRSEVLRELQGFVAARDVLVLPVTAVIETGNFIAQVEDGQLRRRAATLLDAQLRLASQGQAPYIFHDFAWSPAFVGDFLDGAGTGQTLVQHAMAGLGAGDLLILAEMDAYRRRARLPVRLWTRDSQLAAYG
jgi:hypothetical protein